MDTPIRKISKAVYLLLAKYHRLYGLEAYLFSGGHGSGYVGFQVAANRCWDGANNKANYNLSDPDTREHRPLVTYLCGPVAIPAWADGKQQEMPDWESARTNSIVDWLEKHLALKELFADNADAISRWRQNYSVEESEQYLLMVNLAGLLATKINDMPRTPSQSISEYDTQRQSTMEKQVRNLGLLNERGTIMGIPGIMIARNGKALVGDHEVNIWQHLTKGNTPVQIANDLLKMKTANDKKVSAV